MVMETRFNPLLVLLSVLVAIFASYVALNLAHSVTQAKGRAQARWLGVGAFAMGLGIWSMHFVGMLAFEMPGMPMAYDIPLMVLSVLVAISASGLALFITSRPVVPLSSLASGGIAMAAAIAGMHYIGMFSMRMAAAIQWDLFLVVLSIFIALIAAIGALFILNGLRNKTDHFGELFIASVLMGIAISGMHYTGMLAATFVHDHSIVIEGSYLLVSSELTMAVLGSTLLVLSLALSTSMSQRLWAIRRKRAEEILGKSEERFRRLVEAVKDYAIFMLDADGNITTWNLGAERITGYSEAEVLGKHVSVFYTRDDIDNSIASKELRAAQDNGHFESEGQRVRKDGSMYWANVVIAPLYDQQGALAGFSKVTRDITQFKESERDLRHLNEDLESRVHLRTKALEQREHQLRSITNALPVLIAQMDRDERVMFANEGFCKWFNYDGAEIIGKSFCAVLGPDRYLSNKPYIQKVLAGEQVTYERESQSGDLTAILGITFVPEFDLQNQVTGFIVLASDITKHKAIQTELKEAKEAAEVANATKSAFLANMSHEIRTPLGAVLGFSELLLTNDMSPSERNNSVEIVKRNGRLLSNIINDILDLSKVEAGKLDIEKVEVSFSEILKELGSVLSLEADVKGIELKVIAEGTIPLQIKTDPLRLRQILLNIVGNAIKFTSRGSVTVKVKLLPNADSPTKLAFIVTDTGEGIRPEQAKRLFTPFTQADVSTTRKFGGTGLGLVLSKKLANTLGGDVVLTETSVGKGSTFVVTIDPGFSEGMLFQHSDAQTASNMLPETKRPRATLNQMKILVVDDSLDNLRLIKIVLSLAGAKVDTAKNGKEAVEKTLSGDYDLVLMDLQMPEMDGYEATKVLRERGYGKPIIALTAHAMKEERQRTLQSGFNDHITKPIDQAMLLRTLSEYSV